MTLCGRRLRTDLHTPLVRSDGASSSARSPTSVSRAAPHVRPTQGRAPGVRSAVPGRPGQHFGRPARIRWWARGPPVRRPDKARQHPDTRRSCGLAAGSHPPGSVEAPRTGDRACGRHVHSAAAAHIGHPRRSTTPRPRRLPAGPDRHPCARTPHRAEAIHQPTALLGSVLLASIATLSLALPVRLTAFWQVPGPVGLLLWVPLQPALQSGRCSLRFLRSFPAGSGHFRMTLALVPAVIIVGWHLYGWR